MTIQALRVCCIAGLALIFHYNTAKPVEAPYEAGDLFFFAEDDPFLAFTQWRIY